jgi:cardiolipin synthase
MVTESFIPELLASGIKVYTYDPGFIHSKLIVVDQSYGMIGTANFDYRSLYLHFENSVYIEDQKTIKDMLTYFNQSLDQSSLIIDYKQHSILYKALQMILRGFAPLM